MEKKFIYSTVEMSHKTKNANGIICRACKKLSIETDQMVALQSACIGSTEFQTVSDLFARYTFLEAHENDGISQYICVDCHRLLEDFHEFREMCVVTCNELLKEQCIGIDCHVSPVVNIKYEDPLQITDTLEESGCYEQQLIKTDPLYEDYESFSNDLHDIYLPEDDGLNFEAEDHSAAKEPVRQSKPPSKISTSGLGSKICGLNAKSSLQLKHYVKKNANKSERPVKCHHCDKTFRRNFDLQYHLLVSSGIKAFQCSICEARKTTKYELTKHMNTHTKAKAYKCELCPKIFYRTENLLNHRKRSHHIEKLKSRQLRCSVCGILSRNMQDIAEHVSTHTISETGGGDNDDDVIHIATEIQT